MHSNDERDESEDDHDGAGASRGPKRKKVTNQQTQVESEGYYEAMRRPKSGRGSRGGRQGRGIETGRAGARKRRKSGQSDNVNDGDDEEESPDII